MLIAKESMLNESYDPPGLAEADSVSSVFFSIFLSSHIKLCSNLELVDIFIGFTCVESHHLCLLIAAKTAIDNVIMAWWCTKG